MKNTDVCQSLTQDRNSALHTCQMDKHEMADHLRDHFQHMSGALIFDSAKDNVISDSFTGQ